MRWAPPRGCCDRQALLNPRRALATGARALCTSPRVPFATLTANSTPSCWLACPLQGPCHFHPTNPGNECTTNPTLHVAFSRRGLRGTPQLPLSQDHFPQWGPLSHTPQQLAARRPGAARRNQPCLALVHPANLHPVLGPVLPRHETTRRPLTPAATTFAQFLFLLVPVTTASGPRHAAFATSSLHPRPTPT